MTIAQAIARLTPLERRALELAIEFRQSELAEKILRRAAER